MFAAATAFERGHPWYETQRGPAGLAKEDDMKRNATTRRLLLTRRAAARRRPGLGPRRRPGGELVALARIAARSSFSSAGLAEPDNLNPFVGWATTTYEIWTVNYNFLFGFDGQT